MLDTSVGQVATTAAAMGAYNVNFFEDLRHIDPDYNPLDDPRVRELPAEFIEEMIGSTSQQETSARLFHLQQNIDMRTSLENWGGTRFVANFLDPINIIPVPFALGKGFLPGLKRALAGGTPIVAGTEMIRHDLDASSTAVETFMNIGAGILFMGAIGGAAGKYARNPDAMRASEAFQRVLDTVAPIKKENGVVSTNMFAGVPPHVGNVSAWMKRHLFRSNVTDAPGVKVKKGGRFDLRRADSEPLARQGGPVPEPEGGYPRGYMPDDASTGGATYARRLHELLRRDVDSAKQALDSPEIIKARAKTLGVDEDEIVKAMQKEIDSLEAEIKQGDEFFARDDVQKQLAIEDEIGGIGVRSLDDVTLVRDPELDLIDNVPSYMRNELRQYTEVRSNVKAKLDKIDAEIEALKKKQSATSDKGWKKRYQKQIDAFDEPRRYMASNLERINNQVAFTRRSISDLADQKIIDIWDLMPTGYNSALGKLKQFPYWHLLRNEFRGVAPEVAKDVQLFALQLFGAPGISAKANTLGKTAGASVENMAHTWFGPFIKALKGKQKLYTKYLGYGDDTTMFNAYWIDQKQRVRGTFAKRGLTESFEERTGKITMAEFNERISRRIITGTDDSIAEVNSAAELFNAVTKEFGDEGRRLGIFWSQKNAQRQLDKVQQQIDNLEAKFRERPSMRTPLLKQLDDLEMEKMRIEGQIHAYEQAGSPDLMSANYFHRMWRADVVREKKPELIDLLERWFRDNPKHRFDDDLVEIDAVNLRARAEEAYSSILREADGADTEFTMNSIDKLEWLEARKKNLERQIDDTLADDLAPTFDAAVASDRIKIIDRKIKRIRDGETTVGGAGPLIQRKLDIPNELLLDGGFIETDIDTVMGHYVSRMSPAIELSRKYGDINARGQINRLHERMIEAAGDNAQLIKHADDIRDNMSDMVQIVQGVYQIPDDPAAITGRTLRLLRNFNVLTAMGRATLMAMADVGNVMISQGVTNTFGSLIDRWASGVNKGNVRMIDAEVELAGAVTEVAMGMRYHQFTEIGASWFASNRLERSVATATQRFFLTNLMGPWTDMMKKTAGGMVQSQLIKESLNWKAGTITAENRKILARLGISEQRAIQIADQWEAAGSLKHKSMFIANTEQWTDDVLRREFRSAINNEVNRAVITPGAPDKPKALLKSEWWKVFGQYKGFAISATHRVMGAGLQQKGAQKYAGFMSMIGIAMMVDMFKRPDYIQLSPYEQVLRAVELSGVTGIILDLNDTIERASAGALGIRPAIGMDIRERNPTWATRVGAVAGSVPNQWLQLMWALTSEDAETRDQARIMRYMIPYNNIFYWKTVFDRSQRSLVDTLEDNE